MSRTVTVLGLVFAFIILGARHAQAVDGTWTNLAGGAWSTAANWNPNTVADGTGAVADFSTLNLTANAFVNNDAPRTVGHLRFGDTTPNQDWTLTNSTLTLAVSSGTPTITVSNQTATIANVLLGTQGFVKQGSGTLKISGRSTMAGDITVNQGMIENTLGGLRDTSGSVTVSAGATLYVHSGFGASDGRYEMTNSITLSGTGMDATCGALHGMENFTCIGPITLLTDSRITHGWNNFYLSGAISGTDKNLILQATDVDGVSGLFVSGSMSLGSGALSVIGSGYVYLNAANSFSGGTTVGIISSGALNLGHVNALGSGGLTVNSGVVNLNTRSISIPSLSGSGGIITDTGSAGTTTLTVTQSVSTTYSGVIRNGASRVIALTKTGSGKLTLVGRNTYSGATTVNVGGLVGVTGGSCMNSSVTVADGATNGVIAMAPDSQWMCAGLTYTGGTACLDLDLSTFDVSSLAAPLKVNGSLSVTGTVNVVVRNGYWPAATIYPLISYDGSLNGSGSFTLAGLPAGVSATLVNNTGAKRLDLNVTAVPTVVLGPVSAWTNLVGGNASGLWGTTGNWSNGVPDATNAVADFSTLDITVYSIVTNAVNRTVGLLRFGDTTPNKNLMVTTSSGATLTLATSLGSPEINVSNRTAYLNLPIIGTRGFTKTGVGVLYFHASSPSLSGTIYLTKGTLAFGADGSTTTTSLLGNGPIYMGDVIGNDNVTLSGGLRASVTISNNIVVQSGGTGTNNIGATLGDASPVFAGSITLGSPYSTGKSVRLSQTNGTSHFGLIQDPVGLVGAGGTVTIEAGGNGIYFDQANTYSGPTVILSGGTNYQSIANAVPAASAVTVNSGGRFGLNLYNGSIGSLAGSGSVGLGQSYNTLAVGNDNTSTTFSGIILGAGSLTKTGSGALTLSGVNTYGGITTISNGTMVVSNNLALSTNTVVLAGGGLGASTGTWAITNVVNAKAASSLGASGTLALMGNVTNDGALTVVSGGILINGSKTGTGALTVSGGYLGGTGAVAGTVTNRATITAGDTNSIGTLTVTNLVMAENSAMVWNYYSASSQDTINVTGNLTLPNVATVNVSQVSSGRLPNPAVLFNFGTGLGAAATDANLVNWVITGARSDTRAAVRGNQVQLLSTTGMILEIY